jgi:D-alanyl-D-alanine carboxypeptidase
VGRRRFDLEATVVAGTVFALGCQPPPGASAGTGRDLQLIVDRAVADNAAVSGAALHVDAPALDLDWQGAAGFADPSNAAVMTPLHPVRIASNTKTFVAATVLRLVEEGRLGIDDPIADHLPDDTVEILVGGGYHPEMMTVRHLLTHTSGLFDHSDSQNYGDAITADPQHRWTRTEQLEAAMAWGQPWGAPGEVYTYCDTGYVLLGGIIEQASSQPLSAAVRSLLRFDELGLRSTWWEEFEPVPDGVPERAHQLIDEVDTVAFDPSFDLYGGGGLVSTVGDLAVFYRALFTGGVFTDPATLRLMLTTVDGARPRPGADETALPPGTYRMGIWVLETAGVTAYAHSGFWGTAAVYVPELDLAVAATVNQNKAKEAMWDMVARSIEVVRQRQGDLSP